MVADVYRPSTLEEACRVKASLSYIKRPNFKTTTKQDKGQVAQFLGCGSKPHLTLGIPVAGLMERETMATRR